MRKTAVSVIVGCAIIVLALPLICDAAPARVIGQMGYEAVTGVVSWPVG